MTTEKTNFRKRNYSETRNNSGSIFNSKKSFNFNKVVCLKKRKRRRISCLLTDHRSTRCRSKIFSEKAALLIHICPFFKNKMLTNLTNYYLLAADSRIFPKQQRLLPMIFPKVILSQLVISLPQSSRSQDYPQATDYKIISR